MNEPIYLQRAPDKDDGQIKCWRAIGKSSKLFINSSSLVAMIAGESPANGLESATPYALHRTDADTYQMGQTEYKLTSTNKNHIIQLTK
jgi:hypothetical protein